MRPIDPKRLDEHQHGNFIILDEIANDGEEPRFAPREESESLRDHSVTLETARYSLAEIPGSLDVGLPR